MAEGSAGLEAGCWQPDRGGGSGGGVLCPCAGGRGRRNDNKDNHVVGGLVVYQGVVQ